MSIEEISELSELKVSVYEIEKVLYRTKEDALFALKREQEKIKQAEKAKQIFTILKSQFENIEFEKVGFYFQAICGKFRCLNCEVIIVFKPLNSECDVFDIIIDTSDYQYNKEELIVIKCVHEDNLISKVKEGVEKFVKEFLKGFS